MSIALAIGLTLLAAFFIFRATSVVSRDVYALPEMADGTRFNPLDPSDAYADPDGDGLTNVEEFYYGTNPYNPDTDGDGMPDGWEVMYGLDPLDPTDKYEDADAAGERNGAYTNNPGPHAARWAQILGKPLTGWHNYGEYLVGSSPIDPDTTGNDIIDPEDPCLFGECDPTDMDFDPDDPWRNQDAWEDQNHDGIPDHLEDYDFNDDGIPDYLQPDDPTADSDGDGIPNGEEWDMGTDPMNPDSTDSGFTDAEELDMGLDPANPDTDGDGVPDHEEIEQGTDPNDADSSDTGIPDGLEQELTDPITGEPFDPTEQDTSGDGIHDGLRDSDGDGIHNWEEVLIGTHPGMVDTDGDGIPDNVEIGRFYAPIDAPRDENGGLLMFDRRGRIWNPSDFNGNGIVNWEDPDINGNGIPNEEDPDMDGDGIPNEMEAIYGTCPMSPDTDGDGLSDYEEIYIYGTDPLDWDTSGNGLWDWFEVLWGTDPVTGEWMTGTRPDGTQFTVDPTAWDSSGNGYSDYEQIMMGNPPWAYEVQNYDTDGDGLPSWYETGDLPGWYVDLLPAHTRQLHEDHGWVGTFTLPNNPDSASTEAHNGFRPLRANMGILDGDKSSDNDGRTNRWEYLYMSSPWCPDNHGDGHMHTDPTREDSSGDGIPDNLDPDPNRWTWRLNTSVAIMGVSNLDTGSSAANADEWANMVMNKGDMLSITLRIYPENDPDTGQWGYVNETGEPVLPLNVRISLNTTVRVPEVDETGMPTGEYETMELTSNGREFAWPESTGVNGEYMEYTFTMLVPDRLSAGMILLFVEVDGNVVYGPSQDEWAPQ